MYKRCFKLILVLALMSLVLGSSFMPVLGHNFGRGGYDYDQIKEIVNPDWMAPLSDLRISELSIPGTHDTMATCRNAGSCGTTWIEVYFTRCQAFSLDDQLQIGIRALDIRCRHLGDRFAIYHGDKHLDGMWFDTDVLEPVKNFLKEHENETVLMRIQETSTPEGNTRTFSETFEWYKSLYKPLIWEPTGEKPNPTLGEVRGKIVILDRFSGGNKYGIDWDDTSYVHIQDYWDMKQGFNDMVYKWQYEILEHLEKADTGRMDDIYINFLSGVGDGPDCYPPDYAFNYFPYPWFVASGHISEFLTNAPGTDGGHQTWRVGCSTSLTPVDQCGPFYLPNGVTERPDRCIFTGMNELILDKWINAPKNEVKKKTGRIGIIMADFPSDLLVDAIIDLNPPNKESPGDTGGGGGCFTSSF